MSWVPLLPVRHKHSIPCTQDIETRVALGTERGDSCPPLPGRRYMINALSAVVLFIFKAAFLSMGCRPYSEILDGDSRLVVSFCENVSL